jgi:hypothetical protein
LGSQTHTVSIILPSIKAKTNLEIAELAETEGLVETSRNFS